MKVLGKYKKDPCILARKNNAPENSAAHMVQLVEMLIQKSFKGNGKAFSGAGICGRCIHR